MVYLLRAALPVATALVLLRSDGFYLLAEFGLLLQVLFLTGTDALEMLLMAFVDDGRSSLEAVPDLFAQVFRHRTYLAILLMQLLQLVEGTDDVVLLGQLLGSLAELCLQLQIFLEVVFTGLAVQFQQVIELLYIQLVVTPQLVGLLGRHGLDVTPLLLQGLELLVCLVGLLG